MKVTWEHKDIVAGRIVGKAGRKERWMIGYRPEIGFDRRYTLNSLCDGMVTSAMTPLELAEHLNKTGDIPVELLERADVAA